MCFFKPICSYLAVALLPIRFITFAASATQGSRVFAMAWTIPNLWFSQSLACQLGWDEGQFRMTVCRGRVEYEKAWDTSCIAMLLEFVQLSECKGLASHLQITRIGSLKIMAQNSCCCLQSIPIFSACLKLWKKHGKAIIPRFCHDFGSIPHDFAKSWWTPGAMSRARCHWWTPSKPRTRRGNIRVAGISRSQPPRGRKAAARREGTGWDGESAAQWKNGRDYHDIPEENGDFMRVKKVV